MTCEHCHRSARPGGRLCVRCEEIKHEARRAAAEAEDGGDR